MLDSVVKQLGSLPGLAECVRALERNEHTAIVGCNSALLAALAQWLRGALKKPVLVIARGTEDAERLYLSLETFCGGAVSLFSAHTWDKDDMLPNLSVNLERMETFTGLQTGRVKVVVAPCMAVLQDVPSPEEFNAHTITLEVGRERDLTELLRTLLELGYERADMVEFRGEFSARGGIVDVFPVTADDPIRIEFFGDEICSLRTFEIHSQRSNAGEDFSRVLLPAARESSIFSTFNVADAEQSDAAEGSPGAPRALAVRPRAHSAGENCESEIRNPKSEIQTTNYQLPTTNYGVSLLDYFDQPPLIVWHEFRQTVREMKKWGSETSMRGTTGGMDVRFNLWQSRCAGLPCVYGQELEFDVPDIVAERAVRIATESVTLVPLPTDRAELEDEKPYQFNLRVFARQLREWRDRKYDVTIVSASDAERKRLAELLETDAGIDASFYHAATAVLTDGWILPACRQVVVTDDEIFRRVYMQQQRRRRMRRVKTAPIENIATINIGEYVVHINHGIGQFEGIRNIALEDSSREMIIVRYADDALLYVPLEQAHLIERYVSVGDGKPALDSLGGGRWAARRRKAERAVLDLAAELLERQALRAALEGYAFSRDSEWQLAFEKAFPYPETPDQAAAIHDVKSDMQSARPMDRLICGDVGFGKTEVAIRAAFKAVLEGKQVALLAPTTILVQQHWHTFSERVADYPVRVEMLSRFVHPREQKKTVQALADGQVDIVIGTHRLLSKDVSFSDLGLVIVDEEQRFGVRHKEKLKKLRELVDILALSATPIPRTLYQSLTSARDMSTILTPPEERIPVKTLLIKRDDRIIREAILRELARDGQAFFLHNRVQTIGRVREKLEKLVPTARFVIAHGQMDEDELAQTMEDFAARRYDVLVCTMIVESGLDMPNVNTMIIDNADKFGLADLYQLRGRVGRSSRQAYAYLVVPGDLAGDTAARHRLKAILENTALGSGYTIAMKDLEIRGAGNILGPQQSGHIASIGFGLYCKLLGRAVELLKEGKLTEILKREREAGTEDEPRGRVDWRREIPEFKPVGQAVELHLPFAGNIPEDYIESAALRLDLFRRVGNARRVGVIRKLEEEMRDRFGPLPNDAVLLLRMAEARLHAHVRGVDSIEVTDRKVILRRRGRILTPTSAFPRITPSRPLDAMDIILAYLSQLKPLG